MKYKKLNITIAVILFIAGGSFAKMQVNGRFFVDEIAAVFGRADSDADGLPDEADNCPNTANANQADADNDGVGDVCDNCPLRQNPTQADTDNDGTADACDNCPSLGNSNQADSDGDSIGNTCDNCPNTSNANQLDSDADGIGNACDAVSHNGSGIIYVKQNGTGNGSSWSTAIGDLQNAINAAGVTEVWVAKGEYLPAAGASFAMKPNVKIYGGFPNTGSPLMADRNWKIQETLLKGNGNRVIHNNNVIMNTTTVLDGFTITEGILTVDNISLNGAGMLNQGSASPLVNNCTFKANTIVRAVGSSTIINGKGGGMANLSSNPTVTNCVFLANVAVAAGGGIYNENAVPKIKGNVFSANVVTATSGSNGGGGIYNTGTYTLAAISDCLFIANQAAYGAAIRNAFTSNKNQEVINCTFYDNRSTAGSRTAVYNNFTTLTFTNTIAWANTGTLAVSRQNGADPVYRYSLMQGVSSTSDGNIDASDLNNDPQFVDVANPQGADGVFGTADDGLALKKASLLISKGSNVFYGVDLATSTDLVGNARLQKGAVDLGPYESAFAPQPVPNANGIVYVRENGSGNFIADSWDNAAPELADALVAAKNNTAIKEIWVSAGSYKPLYSAADNNFGNPDGRNNTFLLVRGVKMYGGFPSIGNPLLSDRNVSTNKTILTGDFIGNDLSTGSGTTLSITGNEENSYIVVVAAGQMDDAELGGFEIRGGNANSTAFVTVNGQLVSQRKGAGLTNLSASYLINNCSFESNCVDYGDGAGVLNANGANPTISDCKFLNNLAFYISGQGLGDEGGGAGMANILSSPTIMRSEFAGNLTTGGRLGGAVYNSSSNAVFYNCSFNFNAAGAGGAFFNLSSNTLLTNLSINNNIASHNGGGIFNSSSLPVLTNVTITKNEAQNGAGNGGGLYYDTGSGGSLRNSIVWGNLTSSANGIKEIASYNTGINKLKVSNSIVKDYQAGEPGLSYQVDNVITQDPNFLSSTDFRLQTTSPAINFGDQTLFDVGQTPDLSLITTDLAGNNRIEGANIDLGAYEIPAVLPVNFDDFTAIKQSSGVLLKWQTVSETNNKAFILSRSANGKSFTELHRVLSKGNSNSLTSYTYQDNSPLVGLNYYQLQQIDLDGTTTLLGHRVIDFVLSQLELKVYPNPAMAFVKVSLDKTTYKEAKLINIYGQQLIHRRISEQENILTFELANLPKGIYFIELLGESKRSFKLIKH